MSSWQDRVEERTGRGPAPGRPAGPAPHVPRGGKAGIEDMVKKCRERAARASDLVARVRWESQAVAYEHALSLLRSGRG